MCAGNNEEDGPVEEEVARSRLRDREKVRGVCAVDAPLDRETDGPDVLDDVLDQKTFQESQVPSNLAQYGQIFAHFRASTPSPRNPGENAIYFRSALQRSRRLPRGSQAIAASVTRSAFFL